MSNKHKDKIEFLLEVATNKSFNELTRKAATDALVEMDVDLLEIKRYRDASEFVKQLHEDDIVNEYKHPTECKSSETIRKEIKLILAIGAACIIGLGVIFGLLTINNNVKKEQTQIIDKTFESSEKGNAL